MTQHTRILCKELAVIFLIFVVILLIGGLVTYIAVQNITPPVQLDLFSWHIRDYPLGVWLIAAFLCGAIVLYLISMLFALEDRHKMKVLRKRVVALEKQVAATTQTSSAAAGQASESKLVAADAVPMMPMPGVMNTPQPPDGRIPSAPLSPLQNFRQ
jgi:uncharacterized integral membrane protein